MLVIDSAQIAAALWNSLQLNAFILISSNYLVDW
jgi:hypothetical protein